MIKDVIDYIWFIGATPEGKRAGGLEEELQRKHGRAGDSSH